MSQSTGPAARRRVAARAFFDVTHVALICPTLAATTITVIGSQRRGARAWRVRFLIPLSIRACGFPAHGLPMIFLMVTTRIPGSGRCRASGRGRGPRRTHASRSTSGQL